MRKSVPQSPEHASASHLTGIPEHFVHPQGRRASSTMKSGTLSLQSTPTVRATSGTTRARWENPLSGLRFAVGQILPHLRPDAPSRLHRRARGTCPLSCEGASGHPHLSRRSSSGVFHPRGERRPMSRPQPAAPRQRERQNFCNKLGPSRVFVDAQIFHRIITSLRNDVCLDISHDTWGHGSNSNLSTSLFPQVLTL